MALSGKYWPAHLKPYFDELLSSWLVRLARANGLKLHTFCDLAWPKKPIWNRDIDKSADAEIIQILVEKTATPIVRARATCLRKYEGTLYENHNPNGNTHFILPLGVYHRTHRRYGLQFCPQCLAEDEDPYFRCRWRLAIVTVCEKHKTILADRCPDCQEPVNFHRISQDVPSIAHCWRCGFDVRGMTPRVHSTARRQAAGQKTLLQIIRRGWVEIPGSGPIYSVCFFPVLRQIMKILGRGKAEIGRECLVGLLNLPKWDGGRAKIEIEMLDLEERYQLIAMALWALEDWPQRWVSFCRDHRIWTSELFRDMRGGVPYWFWKVGFEDLYGINYCISDEEIIQAAIYLERTGREVTETEISRLLGVNQVFRKRMLGKTEASLFINDSHLKTEAIEQICSVGSKGGQG